MVDKNIDIEELKSDIKKLKEELQQKEELLEKILSEKDHTCPFNNKFTTYEIVKYSRQIIIPEVGVEGQIALKNSKVLVVGAGGLGCPAALYLARAGIGEITIIDYDEVELTNLHRQILYTERDIGLPKVNQACKALKSANRHVKVIPLQIHANSKTLGEIVASNNYDVIIDGSDNVMTRYIVNRICVLNNIPLVSGSALRMEGQLTVYNYKGGPCYRCLFPEPPPPETVTSCGDGGVLGVVPGLVGVLQALETIKILIKSLHVLSGRLLLIDGLSGMFRTVKLRLKHDNCFECGDKANTTPFEAFEQLCGKGHDKTEDIEVLSKDENINVKQLVEVNEGSIIVDVRPAEEYEMCKLPYTLNFPYSKLDRNDWIQEFKELVYKNDKSEVQKVYVLCRRGNDSQRAITRFKTELKDAPLKFYNVKGGLLSYAKNIDSSFPVY